MRLRNIKGGRAFLEAHPELVIPDPLIHQGAWRALFGGERPLHLEIGMGKGQFICGMAQRHPDVAFVGVEKFDSVVVRALKRCLAEGWPNIRMVRAEAKDLVSCFAPGEVDRLYLNFSDPWPSKGHAKRRLTHPEHLACYRTILAPGAEIHFKTDNRGLFTYTLQTWNACGLVFRDLSLDLHAEEPEHNVRTEYEELWAAKGASIYRLVASFPS